MVRFLLLSLSLTLGAALHAQSEPTSSASVPSVVLSPGDVALAYEFSPLPQIPADHSNAVADNADAALLGQALFYDPRLSGDGKISCSTCHLPNMSFGDGRALAKGVSDHSRHAMTLWNVAYNRWFFWDGRKDTLWSQALAPLEDGREHATSRLAVAHVLANDPDYSRAYKALFGPLPDLSDSQRFPSDARPSRTEPDHPHVLAWTKMDGPDQELVNDVYVNVGKSIAAFERRLVSRRAPFDVFVEGLREGDAQKLAAISPGAQRGFALFAGKGQCFICHDGPNFSDGEFHSNRLPIGEEFDPGRATGIRQILSDPFNLNSRFSDDGGRLGRTRLAIAPRQLHIPGDFKTPTLRNVARTAPYMHDGQLATLSDVLHFYSTLENAAPADPTGEQLIQPRDFSEAERDDLISFLNSLTDESLPVALHGPPATLFESR
ncbi:MAG: cytochrome c peroxidase [Pseudohongiellaceae bacterium]|jgi:cytochrome c peroxidase